MHPSGRKVGAELTPTKSVRRREGAFDGGLGRNKNQHCCTRLLFDHVSDALVWFAHSGRPPNSNEALAVKKNSKGRVARAEDPSSREVLNRSVFIITDAEMDRISPSPRLPVSPESLLR
jgi:hypothetical protein